MVIRVYENDKLLYIIVVYGRVCVNYDSIVINGARDIYIKLTPETRVSFELV